MNNKAFSLIELVLSMVVGIILLAAMHSLHMYVALWFMKYIESMEMQAKGFFIKNLIEVRKNNSDIVNACASTDIGCSYRLPKYIRDLISRGRISPGSTIFCLNGVREESARVERWVKYWARYIEVDTIENLRENDNITIRSKDCTSNTKIDSRTDKRLLLSVAPECKIENGDLIYRPFSSCFFLLKKKSYSSIYLYEDNREILGLLDRVSKFEILSNYDLKIAGNREYLFHKR